MSRKQDKNALDRGLLCPECECAHLPVVYTRRQGNRIKRLRECRHCGKRIVTYERIPGTPSF